MSDTSSPHLEQPDPQAPNLALETAVRRVSEVVRGKADVVRLSLIALLARGHVLLEDVPGVGKTTLARALARVIGGVFSRVQLTADLLPVDIVGGPILEPDGSLRFRQGPIFANVVLADELNRATPRTQSGLLEAMAERAVSVDGQTHALPEPFFVIATQNPSEHHGTYALPQSQMDRFLFRTALGYPDKETERALLTGEGSRPPEPESLAPVLDSALLEALWAAVDDVTLSGEVADYLQAIVTATRESGDVETGVSTRGLLLYARAARARALVHGRHFVSPEDVYVLAVPICGHRILLRGQDRTSRAEAEAFVHGLADKVPAPA